MHWRTVLTILPFYIPFAHSFVPHTQLTRQHLPNFKPAHLDTNPDAEEAEAPGWLGIEFKVCAYASVLAPDRGHVCVCRSRQMCSIKHKSGPSQLLSHTQLYLSESEGWDAHYHKNS
jgi:hypothetical protein